MSTQPLEQAVAATKSVLANVKADHLGMDTPCASWKVSDLINHVIGAQHFFISGLKGTPPAAGGADASAGDYNAEFARSSAALLDAFKEDGVMEKMITMPFGTMPGAALAGLAATDTFQHGWDLAKATSQNTDLAPDLAASLLERSKMAIQAGFRGPEGAPFGAELAAPEGSSNADQLAAFLGRTV